MKSRDFTKSELLLLKEGLGRCIGGMGFRDGDNFVPATKSQRPKFNRLVRLQEKIRGMVKP